MNIFNANLCFINVIIIILILKFIIKLSKIIMHFIIQLHFIDYKWHSKRVQISCGICSPEDRLDRFCRNAQATNWIEVTKKKIVCQSKFVFYVLSWQKS